MPEIRTTMQPDVVIDVSDIEAADLRAQGLIYDPPAEQSAGSDKDSAKAGKDEK